MQRCGSSGSGGGPAPAADATLSAASALSASSALASITATLRAGLGCVLSDAYVGRRAFLGDGGRPVPWALALGVKVAVYWV